MTSAPFAVDVAAFMCILTNIFAPAFAAASALAAIHPAIGVSDGYGQAAVVLVIYTSTPEYFNSSSLQ